MDRYQRTPDRRRGDRREARGWRETERDTGRGMRPGEAHGYRPGEGDLGAAPGDYRYGRRDFEEDYRGRRDEGRRYAGDAGPGHGRDTYDRVHDSRYGYGGERGAEWGEPDRGRGPDDERFGGQAGRPWDEMRRFERPPREQMEPDWEVDRYDRATLHGNMDRDRFGQRGDRGRSVAPRELDEGRMEMGGASWSRGFDEPSGRYRGVGPKGYRRSDDRIREDVCDALTEHPAVDASDCTVKVENGEVTLEGEVDARRVKHLAEDLACECSGVVDVHNRLRVRRRDQRAEEEDEDDRSNGRHYRGAGSQNARSR